MSTNHEPRDLFVTQLEDRLRTDLARRRIAAPTPRWMPQSRLGFALSTVALVVVSMAAGGAAVAAAYQAQESQLRGMLLGTYQQRLALATQRADIARQQLREAEARAAVGIDGDAAVSEARLRVAYADAEIRVLQIDLEEVRATGREPMKTVSAPLVSGRDLVSDRWRVEMSAKAAARDQARTVLEAAKTRFDVGLATNDDVEDAGARQFELESAVRLAERRLAIRQGFLKGGMSAEIADLRILEAEIDQRRTILARRLDLARRLMADLKARIEIGTSAPMELAQAEVGVLELQLEMKKAEYDLALIRGRIGK